MSAEYAELDVSVLVDTWVDTRVKFTEEELLKAFKEYFDYVPVHRDQVEGQLAANKRLRAFLLESIDNPMGTGWLTQLSNSLLETVEVPQLWLDRLHEALADWLRHIPKPEEGR